MLRVPRAMPRALGNETYIQQTTAHYSYTVGRTSPIQWTSIFADDPRSDSIIVKLYMTIIIRMSTTKEMHIFRGVTTRTCRKEKCTGIGRPFLASHRRQDSVLYNDRPQGLCVVRSLLFALTGPLLNYSTATSHDLCWLHTYLRGSFHYDLQFYYILACLHSRMPPLLFSSPPLNCYAQRVLPLTRSQFLLSFKFVLIE